MVVIACALQVTDDTDPKRFRLPTEAFFYGIGWLAVAAPEKLNDYDALEVPLTDLVGGKVSNNNNCTSGSEYLGSLIHLMVVAY